MIPYIIIAHASASARQKYRPIPYCYPSAPERPLVTPMLPGPFRWTDKGQLRPGDIRVILIKPQNLIGAIHHRPLARTQSWLARIERFQAKRPHGIIISHLGEL